ncbi:MAG: hypothetical protein AAFW98_09985 [Pseudomonadota bacterium]
MTLWLHVGSHKTGTTSIQRTFDASRRVLDRAGIVYPTNIVGEIYRGRTSLKSHLFVSQSVREGRVATHLEAFARAYPGRDMLLSSEHFEKLSHDERKLLAKTAATYFGDVRVIAYFREPLGLAVSRLSTWIKRGEALFDGGRAKVQHYRYIDQLGGWRQAFGPDNVIVRPFDRAAFPGGDIMDDLFAVMGLDPAKVKLRRETDNERMTLRGALAIDALAARLGSVPEPLRLEAARLPGPRLSLPQATLDAVTERSAADVARLAERFGVILPQSNEVALETLAPMDVSADVERLMAGMAAPAERGAAGIFGKLRRLRLARR